MNVEHNIQIVCLCFFVKWRHSFADLPLHCVGYIHADCKLTHTGKSFLWNNYPSIVIQILRTLESKAEQEQKCYLNRMTKSVVAVAVSATADNEWKLQL